MTGRTTGLVLALSLAASGCVEPPPPPAQTPPSDTLDSEVMASVGRSYRRALVFFSGDTVVVSWVADARSQPGGVQRRHRGWLHRGGKWEAFADARWHSAPTREPWRMVPHGSVRLVVGEGGGLDRLVFQNPPRNLELRMGETQGEWAGPRGQVVRLADARVTLADRELRGTLADLSRSWSSDEGEPGDWIFLVSGDSVQIVLEQEADSLPYRAWVHRRVRELEWPRVDVEWSQTRAFEPARREVPSQWLITSPDGDLAGELEVASSELEVGNGGGPVLPVDGLFQVRGTVTIEGRRPIPVYGLIRHRQS